MLKIALKEKGVVFNSHYDLSSPAPGLNNPNPAASRSTVSGSNTSHNVSQAPQIGSTSNGLGAEDDDDGIHI
jgi:hypothetical protein